MGNFFGTTHQGLCGENVKSCYEDNLWVNGMLSTIPFDINALRRLAGKQPDVELVRIGIIAELDAINLYEQLAAQAENELVKKVFLDIANEEKEHFGEFLELLRRTDANIVEAMEDGANEVVELDEE